MASKVFFAAVVFSQASLAFPLLSNRADSVASYEGNPFADVQLFPNPYYTKEIHELAIPQLSPELAAKAAQVAKVPSFQWLDSRGKIALMSSTLAEIRGANKAGAKPPIAGTFVLYNFPDRDCSAKASDGELHLAEGGLEKYKKEYIDPVVKLVEEYADTRIIFVYEPDGLANLVTNMGVEKCANAASAYLESTVYAISALNKPNVALYIDAGHAGWLGWPGNLEPTAEIFASVYRNASKPAAVRGIVTNVSNYNAWNVSVPPVYAGTSPNWDESRYHAGLTPFLEEHGYPAHFLVDTGRSGQQPGGRPAWGNWCNIQNSGFGIRPSNQTGTPMLDAFVWVKPGGEADGTSDTNAARYDSQCSSNVSVTPAPEAGAWFQEYFVMLLKLANPPF